MLSGYAGIVVYALLAQYTLHAYCKQREVSEAEYRYPVRVMNANALKVSEFALYRWYYGPAQYHH